MASPFQDYFSNRLSKLSEAGGEKVGLALAISVDMDVVDSDSDNFVVYRLLSLSVYM